MKNRKWIGLVVAIMGWTAAACAADISSAPVQGQIADWSFIQSKGGMQVGPAIQEKIHSWKFPLICDLSGNSSGILIQKTTVEQQGKDIFISLVLGQTLWTLTPQRGQCKTVVIDSDPGVHEVFYRDAAGKTFHIGFVEFNLDSNALNSPPG